MRKCENYIRANLNIAFTSIHALVACTVSSSEPQPYESDAIFVPLYEGTYGLFCSFIERLKEGATVVPPRSPWQIAQVQFTRTYSLSCSPLKIQVPAIGAPTASTSQDCSP